jgi:betaine-aldehyde dehydrogenase
LHRANLQNFINGEAVAALDGRHTELIDPSTEKAFGTAPLSNTADVDAAYRAASMAFESWRDTTPAERQRALLRLADALEDRAEEIIVAECQNTGKPIDITRSEEIPPALDHLRFFAGAARLLEGRSAGEYTAGHTSYIRREPVGVIGQVTPWNYPLMMAIWKIAPALAAGNTVVLKPSDTTPVTTVLLAEIAAEFLPPGVLNVVCGDRDTGRAVIAHKTPAMVSITGSSRAGYDVAAEAAKDLKRTHLDLGGNAPSSSSTTPTSRLQLRPSLQRVTSTLGRTAPPQGECSPAPASPPTWSMRWPNRRELPRPARRTRTSSTARSTTPASSSELPA